MKKTKDKRFAANKKKNCTAAHQYPVIPKPLSIISISYHTKPLRVLLHPTELNNTFLLLIVERPQKA